MNMNNSQKSTPLTQLPNPPSQQQMQTPQPQQHQYVNDQHRQLITQAHTAAQNFTMPVNTQLGGEYTRDEDATIQETLSHLNGDSQTIQQLPPLQQLPQSPPVTSATFTPPPPHPPMTAPAPMASSGSMSNLPQPAQMQYSATSPSTEVWWSFIGNSELKLVAIVVIITILISILPVEHFLNEYLPSFILRLPYADVIGRSLVAGIMFYVLQALLT